MDDLSVPVLHNFYQALGLLTEEENQKFPLEREIVGLEDEGALGAHEVVNDDDEFELARSLAEVDMSDDEIEE